MSHLGTGEEQKKSASPEREKRKALLEFLRMSQEGFAPRNKDKTEKPKGQYSYGYGLGFITRIRLFLRTINLRKAKTIIIFGFVGWLMLLTLIFQQVARIPENLVRLSLIPPCFVLGCLGFLISYRRENPENGYNGSRLIRGWPAMAYGLLLMVCGFGASIALIVLIFHTFSAP